MLMHIASWCMWCRCKEHEVRWRYWHLITSLMILRLPITTVQLKAQFYVTIQFVMSILFTMVNSCLCSFQVIISWNRLPYITQQLPYVTYCYICTIGISLFPSIHPSPFIFLKPNTTSMCEQMIWWVKTHGYCEHLITELIRKLMPNFLLVRNELFMLDIYGRKSVEIAISMWVRFFWP